MPSRLGILYHVRHDNLIKKWQQELSHLMKRSLVLSPRGLFLHMNSHMDVWGLLRSHLLSPIAKKNHLLSIRLRLISRRYMTNKKTIV